ncbi:coiled-coil domain-containing protein R3HCC1L isoform X1 [Apis dorsata]|uniref:coiled-coil domain-containing protein R3HCC1L isoform X1 n=1 Tax=Apis dorsata TaxID=7462 RepID=UPI0003DF7521|nr:coiled-coil domain-containing protein R3HCC1L isoform X1 [Apis dorsata]
MICDYSDVRKALILRKPRKEKVKRYVKVSRVLVFPPVNNYRRYIIHQLVRDRFVDLHTFSIGQGSARRTVVCYKSDVIRDPKLDGEQCTSNCATKSISTLLEMGIEGQRSPSASPERIRIQRQVKSTPTVEIYRPPAVRRARNELQTNMDQVQTQATVDSSIGKTSRQRRPDRAVYIPRHRRSLETEGSPQPLESIRVNRIIKDNSSLFSAPHGKSNLNIKEASSDVQENKEYIEKENTFDDDQNNTEFHLNMCLQTEIKGITSSKIPTMKSNNKEPIEQLENLNKNVPNDSNNCNAFEVLETSYEITDTVHLQTIEGQEISNFSENKSSLDSVETCIYSEVNVNEEINTSDKCKDNIIMTNSTANNKKNMEFSNKDEITNQKNTQMMHNMVSNVLIISDTVQKESQAVKEVIPIVLPEKKVKKIVRQKSKPAPPPSPPIKKINRDECDWDSLFDDNGDCLDPTLIEELTSAVGNVMIEQPKNDYKPYTKHIEVSSDEFAHVVEIYNFPSEFKTSDLAAVFSPFKNGGFELKWVDDTHCLGVFSSPLVAAEVLASDHPFVKTRPLSEATALSKTKAKRSAEFLQPYRSRPETCAALARRLVTGALGVKLATARQEREHEKNILREAKEKRRLANKQREDVWEGIIPEK